MIKHTIRTRKGGLKEVGLTRQRAIKAHCTECCGWETHPNDCTDDNCALYHWRGRSLLDLDASYRAPTEKTPGG